MNNYIGRPDNIWMAYFISAESVAYYSLLSAGKAVLTLNEPCSY